MPRSLAPHTLTLPSSLGLPEAEWLICSYWFLFLSREGRGGEGASEGVRQRERRLEMRRGDLERGERRMREMVLGERRRGIHPVFSVALLCSSFFLFFNVAKKKANGCSLDAPTPHPPSSLSSSPWRLAIHWVSTCHFALMQRWAAWHAGRRKGVKRMSGRQLRRAGRTARWIGTCVHLFPCKCFLVCMSIYVCVCAPRPSHPPLLRYLFDSSSHPSTCLSIQWIPHVQ